MSKVHLRLTPRPHTGSRSVCGCRGVILTSILNQVTCRRCLRVLGHRVMRPNVDDPHRRRAEVGRVRRAAAQAERATDAEERRLRAEAAARAHAEFEGARTRRRARAEVLQAEMADAIASRTEGGGGSEGLDSYVCVMCREWPAEMWVSFGAGSFGGEAWGPACVICAVPRECVTVPAFEDMTYGTRRRHLAIRHAVVGAGEFRHREAHSRGKVSDHVHLDREIAGKSDAEFRLNSNDAAIALRSNSLYN
jgi:hypothetical protein